MSRKMLKEIKVPSKIKVGGFDYKILVSEYHDKELEDNDNWGEHSQRQRQIRIRTNCSPQQFSQTFFHEILHAIDAVYQGTKLAHDEVGAMANGLFQVLEQLGIRVVK